MIFEHAVFIKPNVPFEWGFSYEDYAPMFRKKFVLEKVSKAELFVCGLGYAYYYINGQKVTEDLFTAPFSDYRKTLWYNRYDVTALLKEGENTIAVVCGNGWYNEATETNWYFHKAPWRDLPKVIARLSVDGETALVTDDSWKCKPKTATFFNQLRSGEYFDARKHEEDWMQPQYDDNGWETALRDTTPPTGVFRECTCEPIRACAVYPAVNSWQIGEQKYVFDVGQNISGYIRITAQGESGDELNIRYAERVDEEGMIQYYGMDTCSFHNEFQTDKLILSGKKITWSPMFVYHGFRYIEIDGIRDVDQVEVSGIFVHQDIKQRTTFSCSDPFLTKLFQAGIMSSWSNMFYVLTDCPTREKLGWANDAQASAEQIMQDFEAEKFFTKWMQDIWDAQLSDGALPGVIPTYGWGFQWGNGPVSDGVLFELPYRVYLHTGNDRLLIQSLGAFDRYLAFLERKKNAEGLIPFGLGDHAAPRNSYTVENTFVNAVLIYAFYKIAALAANIAQNPEYSEEFYLNKAAEAKEFVINTFIGSDGRCTVSEQCSVAMLIYYDLYEEMEPLKSQLEELMREKDFHLNCGMVGLRRLFLALNKCGLEAYAYKVLTAEGYPGFKVWFEKGATTLSEHWEVRERADSENHHMYSDFMSWIIKTLVGIGLNESKPGELEFVLNPTIIPQIDWVKCSYHTVSGNIAVEWKKEADEVVLKVQKDAGVKLIYQGKALEAGESLLGIQLS